MEDYKIEELVGKRLLIKNQTDDYPIERYNYDEVILSELSPSGGYCKVVWKLTGSFTWMLQQSLHILEVLEDEYIDLASRAYVEPKHNDIFIDKDAEFMKGDVRMEDIK